MVFTDRRNEYLHRETFELDGYVYDRRALVVTEKSSGESRLIHYWFVRGPRRLGDPETPYVGTYYARDLKGRPKAFAVTLAEARTEPMRRLGVCCSNLHHGNF